MHIKLFFVILIFALISCKDEVIEEIPVAKSVIFIDLNDFKISDFSKKNAPNLDVVIRSSTELQLNNQNDKDGYDLLTLNRDSEFIKILELNFEDESFIYLNDSIDSNGVFDQASKVFKNEKPIFLYVDAKKFIGTISELDSAAAVLIDQINYSSMFDKTILVFLFNSSRINNEYLTVLLNGPKIRKGAAVEGQVNPIDLQTSIIDILDGKWPEDWQGEKVNYLYSKNFQE